MRLLPRAGERLRARLNEPVDIATLVYFRIVFGAIVVWHIYRSFELGRIEGEYADQHFHFVYGPLTFIRPLPERAMEVVFLGVAIAACMLAVGLFYRASAIVTFAGLTYDFLLDETHYLNHQYLVCLVAFLLIWVPANRAFSLDVLRKPSLRTDSVGAWAVWLIAFQISVAYVFGGIAKLNADWLRGEPLRAWLADRMDFPLIGGLFDNELFVWFFVYGSLIFDLFVVLALLVPRTRVVAYATALLFHLLNSRLFSIGIFPWFMIAATPLLMDPAWPRRLLHAVRGRSRQSHWARLRIGIAALIGGAVSAVLPAGFSSWHALIGGLGFGIAAYHVGTWKRRSAASPTRSSGPVTAASLGRLGFGFVAIWVIVQLILPLRHFAIPGNVHWTEEGHKFSWHMMLRSKDAKVKFHVRADGEVFLGTFHYLTREQVDKMAGRPQMILQYAHFLDREYRARGYKDVEVYAEATVSLNGRKWQPLIDDTVDLSEESYPWFGHASWIVPLQNR